MLLEAHFGYIDKCGNFSSSLICMYSVVVFGVQILHGHLSFSFYLFLFSSLSLFLVHPAMTMFLQLVLMVGLASIV